MFIYLSVCLSICVCVYICVCMYVHYERLDIVQVVIEHTSCVDIDTSLAVASFHYFQW